MSSTVADRRLPSSVSYGIVVIAVLVCWQLQIWQTIDKEIFDLFCIQPGNPAPSSFLGTLANLIAGMLGAG